MSRLTRDGTAEPVSRDQLLRIDIFVSLGVENEQADAGRDGRTSLARSQAQTGTGKC